MYNRLIQANRQMLENCRKNEKYLAALVSLPKSLRQLKDDPGAWIVLLAVVIVLGLAVGLPEQLIGG